MKWQLPTRDITLGGWFQILATKPSKQPVDITNFRGVPTQIESYSSADPFGDATAVLTFPQVTAFDDPHAADLINWMSLFTNIDIWWVPGVDPTTLGTSVIVSPEYFIDPLTNQPDIIAPPVLVTHPSGSPTPVTKTDNRIKVWEGFVTSIDVTADETSNSVQLQCQGALFQLDRYLQKPFYPPRPLPLESLISLAFDHAQKPHLRTQPLQINWPSGWSQVIPAHGTTNSYTIDATVGAKWTGYASRSTGAWDRVLTGFIQDQLAVMITGPRAKTGVAQGNQWTVLHSRQSPTDPGRTPVLQIRNVNRTPDFTIWLGTPGVTVNLTRDGTQVSNIIYGDGTNIDGTTWRNAVISNLGSRTDYRPLAASALVWPYTDNKLFSTHPFVAEAYLKFGAGFDQTQAVQSAEQTLARDLDPGWNGTMTMRTDPSADLSRFLIRAGMTVRIMGVAGTEGLNFHIPEVTVNATDGSVQLKIDTRYRDLLNLEESIARTRDPLTPTRMLQVNRVSIMIEDIQAPWDYHAGSGFVPKDARLLWAAKPTTSAFPYKDFVKAHPPKRYPHWYVRVNANAKARKNRWTRVPILTSEKGTIRRTEFTCLDANGNILKNPFHVSLYYINVTPSAMPRDSGGPSAYINNSFTSIDPISGNPWPPGNFLAPDPSFIMGWGSRINNHNDRAGFSPGSEHEGNPATGLLIDENTFTFDNTSGSNSHGWNPNLTGGHKQTAASITIYAMFYAEYKQPVYFHGRLWRQEPGT